MKFGFKSIRNFSRSVTFGKNCFLIAAFVQSSHSFCHFPMASSSISLYSVLGGILLKAISVSLSRAAAFESRSASSFRYISTWALTRENSIAQFALSKVDIFFLDSSTRQMWLFAFFNESIDILLSVKIVAVRELLSVFSIDSITSSALRIANCSAWLLEHLLSSLNFCCTASSIPTNIATPYPTRVRSCSLLCMPELLGPGIHLFL